MNRKQNMCALGTLLATTGAAMLPATVSAQAYPAKPIRIIAPFSAGGGVDFVSRITAQKMAAILGQSVIVENRPGAGGNIGTEVVAKAPPDGYTLLVVSNSFTVNTSLYRKVPYDAIKDFESVSGVASYMMYIVGHPSLPARSVKQLIALAQARPGQVNFGSAGAGTTTHIAGELLAYMAKVRLTHIPYKGSGPMAVALLSGEVALGFGSTVVVPHVKAGRLHLLAVSGAKRSETFPDTPTVSESGVPGYEASGWNAMFAPAGTPAAIVKRLSDVVVKGLSQPDAMEAFQRQDLQPFYGSPEALAAVVKTEVVKWGNVIKAARIEQH